MADKKKFGGMVKKKFGKDKDEKPKGKEKVY